MTTTGKSKRFFDNREVYLTFIATTNEKVAVADRIIKEFDHIKPAAGAPVRFFDAGTGDSTVLIRVMRAAHGKYPNNPFLVVGKEASEEDVRISLERFADRFQEHPQTVIVMTNMFYSEAPTLTPRNDEGKAKLVWKEVQLKGTSSVGFDDQIRAFEPTMREMWKSGLSERTGSLVYEKPAVLIMYRQDQAANLTKVIPQKATAINTQYDLSIASQPWRARVPANTKVKNVLKPLVDTLGVGGRMLALQSIGRDPMMEIIHNVWPGEVPFVASRHDLERELKLALAGGSKTYDYISGPDAAVEFRFHLYMKPDADLQNAVNFSSTKAAWNDAVYVAQMDGERVSAAEDSGAFWDATNKVLNKHKGLWFQDETLIVVRTK